MTVPFQNVPANERVPLFYAEVDNSQAGYFAQSVRTLLIGQKLAAGTATANVPQLVSRSDQAKTLFGVGSMLARMHAKYREGDASGEVWCIALDDPGAGASATGSFALTGTATAGGTLNAYIGADRVQVGVAASDTAATVATALAAAINANTDLPVTAAASTGTVTLTARNKGALGNDLLLQMNQKGAAGGEYTPAGITATVNAMSGGSAVPSLAAAVAAMGDDEYDFIIEPYADTTTLDLMRTTMNDTTGRWAWNRQIYGHVYSALRGTFSAVQAAGAARNDQHVTVAGFETLVPNPVWEYAAAYGARNAVFIAADPARPTQTGELTGITAAPASNRYIQTERQTLLNSGIATSYVSGGVVRVERAITTYQKNLWGQADASYLDSETLHQLAAIIRRLRSRITTKYPRHKLANDGTRFGAGAAIVTPSVIRGELAAEYADMEDEGLVENAKAFADNLIVERNADNPNRLDVLFPPDLVNQLRIFAVLAQFRLQY
ncbi:bacteriophage Mu tail sheath family protein [Caballeronia cordobensis]|uniref:Bacteriophage Mu tail sheath family protein n=1 Tax=Caballeronia cordobensis TaxID=1353886 RepID=A0A158FLC6_CABCO|nr:phage tail sheath subtilisin-like domain-containing protein [Caballeronia cordobensis]SAL20706.1 bacteriophage Mu tail sheath family protein [Caballeronia cordobensis]